MRSERGGLVTTHLIPRIRIMRDYMRKLIVHAKALLMVISILLCVMLSVGCVSSMRQVTKIKKAIPNAIGFIEDNKEFLDLLIDIRDRIREFNEGETENADQEDIDGIKYYLISITREELKIRGRYGNPRAAIRIVEPGSRYDILGADEKQVIKEKLIEMMPDDHPFGLRITTDEIILDYTRYHRAYLYIEHPPYETERGNMDTYTWYEYAKKVNDDWCIHIYKSANN